MTVKQYVKKKGWQVECESKPCRAMTVDIAFYDNNNQEDETEFDIKAYDVNELSDLFSDFCKENDFPENTVYNIGIIAMADTMDELMFGK